MRRVIKIEDLWIDFNGDYGYSFSDKFVTKVKNECKTKDDFFKLIHDENKEVSKDYRAYYKMNKYNNAGTLNSYNGFLILQFHLD